MNNKQKSDNLAFQLKAQEMEKVRDRRRYDNEMQAMKIKVAEVEEDKSRLQQQMERYIKKFEEKEKRYSLQIAELEATTKSLTDKLQGQAKVSKMLLEAKNAALDKLAKTTSGNTEALKTVKEEHEAAMSCLKTELDKMKMQNKQLQERVEKQSEEIHNMTDIRQSTMEEQARKQEAQITTLKNNLSDTKATYELQIQNLTQSLTEKEAAVQDAEDERTLTVIEYKRKEDQMYFESREQREELKILRMSVGQLQVSNKESETKTTQLKENLKEANTELSSLNNDYQRVVKQFKKANSSLSGLKVLVKEQDEKISTLQKELGVLKKENRDKCQTIQKQAHNISCLKQENAKLKSQILFEKKKPVNQKNAETSLAVSDCKQRIIDGFKEKVRMLEKVMENQTKEIDRLKKSSLADEAKHHKIRDDLLHNLNQGTKETTMLKSKLTEAKSQLLKSEPPKSITARVKCWFRKNKVSPIKDAQEESQVPPTDSSVPDVSMKHGHSSASLPKLIVVQPWSKPVGKSEPDGLPPVDIY